MRYAPAFWGQPPGLLAELLLPVGTAWDAVGRLRRALSRPYRSPAPVVCVGNLVIGGAGKTPVVLALAARFAARGIAAHIVTRGYGGRLKGPLRVDPALHDTAAVGDEALLLAAAAPCWIARDRPAGMRAAVAAGARLLLLDDGLQNPTFCKDLSLAVVDAGYGFGNGRVIPSGPLRENLTRGLSRADAAVLVGTDANGSSLANLEAVGIPLLRAVLTPIAGERLAGSRLLAFAGIGRPEKFFASLRSVGAQLVEMRAFPDHCRFRDSELDRLRRDAERAGARLVTTAKDIVRISPANRLGLEVLDVEIEWQDSAALDELIAPVLSRSTAEAEMRDLRNKAPLPHCGRGGTEPGGLGG
jgi:tetraacyldisaccharide 4'-kinase